MLYAVYPLRRFGEKLHEDDSKMLRVVGDLRYDARGWHPEPRWRVMCAKLLASDGETYILPVLDHARIEIQQRGILIQGTELIPVDRSGSIKNIKCHEFRQSWVCKPVTSDLRLDTKPSPAVSRGFERRAIEAQERRVANKIGQTMTDPHVRRSR